MLSTRLIGGLANNLFQIAQVFSFSKKHGIDYCVPVEVINPHIPGRGAYIFPGIKYCDNPPTDLLPYKEKHFHYEEIPKMDNVCFDGYWQSENFFIEHKEELLKALGFDWQMNKGWVSLHYRAADYRMQQEYHPVITEDYIDRAIFYFYLRGYKKFFVCSDEIETIKGILSQDKYSGGEIYFDYSENQSEIDDLQEGSCCQHQIISNSAFSLWQHILNKNPDKICIAPKIWFGESLKHHDLKDLYPPKSIIL